MKIKLFATAVLLAIGLNAYAVDLKWVEPFDAAKQEAKRTGKPMLVFIGNSDFCKDCQVFTNGVCTSQALIDYAATNLICTRVLYSKGDSKEESWKKSRIFESFNMPNAHAVIIASADGKRIGELSTAPQSITAFIQDIQTIIAKATQEGRLKYSEVAMFDQTFVPGKTYTSEPPKFSPEPLKGRYINFMTAVRIHSWENTRARGHGAYMERHKHTPEIALKMRKSLAEAFPEARITWAWSWHALTDKEQNYVELRKLMPEFVKAYNDEMTFWPGVYFEDKFNTLEQAKKDLHEGLELVSQMVGNGYRPKSVVAGHMSVEDMKFLAESEGIHVVQGQIWSQFDVDGQDGDGGIIYPYYPSKDHFLKPAQGPRGGADFVDMVNVDGWTVDFFAARKRGTGKDYNSRVGIGPIETNCYYGPELGLREMLHTTDVHFNDKAVSENGYGFLTVNWELTLFQWIDPNYLPNWLKAVRAKYPDTQMLTLGEFGEKWREHNPDNSRINLKFVERGNDMPSEEEGRKITSKYRFHAPIFCPDMEIRWYFNKDFRFATIQNWKENGPKLVMDYTRYNKPYKEPSGNVIERHWDLLDLINQKESRPQDNPKPFTELPTDEQANILKWYPELNPVSIADMRTEGVCQPMGIEESAPRFSWRYAAGADAPRGFRQSAFSLQVASSVEKLSQGQADLWDSGKQAGADTLSAIYAGKPLASATRYFWKVTGFDAAGKTYSSPPQFFETGLMKAEDWGGAQWIGARKERPKTIPANLQGLKDYSFETKFRIVEGSATFQFRAAYAWQKGYGIRIEPGTPGKFIVTCKKGDNKNEVLKEYSVPKCATNEWHTLQVTLKGADFWFRVNDQPLNDEPLHDETSKEGTLSMGAFSADRKRGLAQFDDFKLTVNGEVFVLENFDNPAMFAFQDCVFSNNLYSRVKDGVMEVSIINVFLDPKEGLAAPLFRKPFSIQPKKIIRARAYVAGLGYYTFWLNGKRMDDYLLQPGFARYSKTAYYTVYDLTAHVERDNLLAFELGRGWYGMTTPTLWGETFTRDWMAEPALRTLVAIDYADGTRQVVVSDPSFKTAPGPILADSVKAGEIHDARKELPGWNSLRFDDANWSPAVIASGTMPSSAPGLTAQLFEPIRVVESLAPISIEKIENEADAWLVDFGTNMAGTVELKLRGEPGQRIRISYLEKITPDNWRGRWNNFGAQDTGSFQMDIFLAKGAAEESFQARYSYKGFRYLRVEGFKDKPSPSQFTAKVFNSDMADVGEFRSSSELWNKIWEAGRRCIQSNMHSIPTDCPQWEKLGWTCDDASPYYAMAFNYDLRKLYEKRLQDYADDISADGKIRNCIPGSWAKGEDPAWVGSYVNLTWKHYQTYGDRRMIERHFDNLKLYMSTLIKEGQASEKPPLLTKPRRALGDWVHPDGGNIPPEGALIYHNLYFFKYARQMAEMANVIGRAEDETFYATLAANLKKRFNEHHFDEKDGFYYSTNRAPGLRQSPQAIALTLGLVPEDKIAGLVDRLVEDIQQRRKGHFWVGILGMEAIADGLCENGRADVAYAAHLRDVGPSLGNMIREGATTLWEDYSIRNARSLNHKMFATPLGWMARYVAGLHVEGVLGEGPGFRKAVIAPYPVPEQIKFAQLDYDSPMGRYHSGWRMTDNGMAYDIVIPPNATALFRLPLRGKKDAIVSEAGKILWQNGKSAEKVDGVSMLVPENDRLVFTLGSGSYSFLVKGN